jgi:hypothetical protein
MHMATQEFHAAFLAHTPYCGQQIDRRPVAIMAGFALRGASSSQPQEPSTWLTCVEVSGMGLNATPFVSYSPAERGYQTRQGQRYTLSRILVSGEARQRHTPWVV